jgi:hypothetical protein
MGSVLQPIAPLLSALFGFAVAAMVMVPAVPNSVSFFQSHHAVFIKMM